MPEPASPLGGEFAAVRAAIVARLRAAGVPSPDADAELLIGHVTGRSRGEVTAAAITGARITGEQASTLSALVARRVAREPLQHLTGVAHFRHLELSVGPGVFVPRPETEILVELVLAELDRVEAAEPRVVDLGTGSGAIALAVATERPGAEVWAVERSEQARSWAARNIAAHAPGRVRLVAGDLADALGELDGTLHVVVSNPPYVPSEAIPRDPEVRDYDPALALYSGDDGLDAVRALAGTARRLLRSDGLVAIEHGETQHAAVAQILADAGLGDIEARHDLTGRSRFTLGRQR